MLWDIIRDFFVQYVFGGWDSVGSEYSTSLGHFLSGDGVGVESYGSTLFLPLTGYDYDEAVSISYACVGDWLATSATIITLCLLLFAVFLGIKFLFKLVAGSFLKIGD